MNGQEVIVIPLQDAGVESGQVGLPTHIFRVDLCGGKVAAKDKVGLVDFWAAVAACENATVSHHSTHTVVPVEDRRDVWEQGLEVVADREYVLVAGVVKVHQLANTHAVLGEGEIVGNINIVEDIVPGINKSLNNFSENSPPKQTSQCSKTIIHCNKIEVANCYKYLRTVLDDVLKFRQNTDITVKKANQRLHC